MIINPSAVHMTPEPSPVAGIISLVFGISSKSVSVKEIFSSFKLDTDGISYVSVVSATMFELSCMT